MEKIITLVIILILFFHLTYMKYKKEHFNLMIIKIYFNKNKSILWNNKNFNNINYNFENVTSIKQVIYITQTKEYLMNYLTLMD